MHATRCLSVTAHNCTAGPVSCTATLCTVKVTGCRTGKPGPWSSVGAMSAYRVESRKRRPLRLRTAFEHAQAQNVVIRPSH